MTDTTKNDNDVKEEEEVEVMENPTTSTVGLDDDVDKVLLDDAIFESDENVEHNPVKDDEAPDAATATAGVAGANAAEDSGRKDEDVPDSSASTLPTRPSVRPSLMRSQRRSSRSHQQQWLGMSYGNSSRRRSLVMRNNNNVSATSAVSQRRLLLRTSSVVDLGTGQEGGQRETFVQQVPTSHQKAMDPMKRMYSQLLLFGKGDDAPNDGGIPTNNNQEEAYDQDVNTERQEQTTSLRDPGQQMSSSEEEQPPPSSSPPLQYRLTSRRPSRRHNLRRRLLGNCFLECLTGIARDDSDEYDVSVGAKADLLTSYLRWTFRTSFVMLLIVSAVMFLLLSCLFAICIHIVGILQPICISVGGDDYVTAGQHYLDAFTLSWTTLSTVGYGHIYPNVAFPGGPRCLLINVFCTLEAFVGVLFASFCGAIIFGKVTRTQSFASTSFSDPIVIRYGTGVLQDDEAMADIDEEENDNESSNSPVGTTKSSTGNKNEETTETTTNSTSPRRKIPCPILEFRVANRMFGAAGGEIMNCQMNVISSILESHASESLQQAVLHKSHRPLLVSRNTSSGGDSHGGSTMTAGRTAGEFVTKHVGKVASGTAKMAGNVASGTAKQVGKVIPTTDIVSGTAKQVGNVAGAVLSGVGSAAGTVATGVKNVILPEIDEGKSFDPDEGILPSHQRSHHLSRTQKQTGTTMSLNASVVDEGSNLVPRRIFSNLEVQTPSHPFFKRVWYIRHVLDETSPLLSARAKAMIVENDGYWPENLNSYEAVREELHFHEIVVNLSGTANATGSVVYSQKVYSFVDVNIGYAFVNMLRRDHDDRLSVDLELLNDVVEQPGGGGEPFTNVMEDDVFGAAVGAAMEAAGDVANNVRSAAENAQDRMDDVVHQATTGAKTAADAVKANLAHPAGSSDFRTAPVVTFKEETTDEPRDAEKTGEKKRS